MFGLAFGVGVVGGAVLSLILLEVRESILRSASNRKRDIAEVLASVAGDFSTLTDDILQAAESLVHGNDEREKLRQGMKTRLRHGGSLDETGESPEMDSLYGEIDPSEV